MATELYWVDGPWPGRLALAARPRGGDWLEDEMAAWRRDGVDTVVSMLEHDEERDLGLAEEGDAARAQKMRFRSIPIVDRRVPTSRADFATELDLLDRELICGRNVVIHCRQGIGRTGILAACLLLGRGETPEGALRRLTLARGIEMPETPEQLRWVGEFAESAILTK